jgi:formylglycine-generating enzyme required for sulfatase activity
MASWALAIHHSQWWHFPCFRCRIQRQEQALRNSRARSCPSPSGTTTRYAFGDTITPKDANYGLNVGKTSEVGTYPPNPWGLYDMHGNVWEWVEDVWHDSYQGAPSDGSAWTDGEGENSSRYRVSRGGSWVINPRILRSAIRGGDLPVIRVNDLGFRVARTLD